MAQVAVQIAGRTYRMACDEGQEGHLMDLARKLDTMIADLKGSFGEIGDQRLTVMAGVMMADELSEAHARVRVLEADLRSLRSERAQAADPERDARIATSLDKAADRLDAIGRKLTAGADRANGVASDGAKKADSGASAENGTR